LLVWQLLGWLLPVLLVWRLLVWLLPVWLIRLARRLLVSRLYSRLVRLPSTLSIGLIVLLIERAAIPLVKGWIDGLGTGSAYRLSTGSAYGLSGALICRRIRRLHGRLADGRVYRPVKARAGRRSGLPGRGIVPAVVAIVAVIAIIPIVVVTIIPIISVTVSIINSGIYRSCAIQALDP
jgi:hypothetical protein